jgi:hypothetical protein
MCDQDAEAMPRHVIVVLMILRTVIAQITAENLNANDLDFVENLSM